MTKRVNFFFSTNLIVARWTGCSKGRKVYPFCIPPKPYPAYTSVVLEYLALTKKRMRSADIKERHHKKMEGQVFQDFLRSLPDNVTNSITQPNIAVQLVLWSDGFEPNQSVKRNRKGAWIMTITFFFYEINTENLYMVDSNLISGGPGKKGDGSESHSVIMKELYSKL